MDFAYNCIVPFELANGGQRVMVDYGKVPLGREMDVKLLNEQEDHPDDSASLTPSYVPVLLDYPERVCLTLSSILSSNGPSNPPFLHV